ncbi:MAG: hypothetical protein HFF09_07310 [Oscillospiraceae bacterium]|nr:hypothetical protein [Oscillospiraceae bacterium]
MKRHITVPLAALLLGAAGFAVRLWERRTAYDAVSGLTELSLPAPILLLALTVAALALALVMARMPHRTFDGGYDEAFYAPSTLYITLVVLAAVTLFAAGVLSFLDYRDSVALYSTGFLQSKPSVIQALLAALCILSGVCVLPVGKNSYRGLGKGSFSAPLLAPAFMSCLWLVASYLEESGNPDLMTFVFGRMAAITAVLALYYICSFSFEKAKPGRTVFFSMAAIFFSFVSLADASALYLRMLGLFAILCLTAQLAALCRNDEEARQPQHFTPEVSTDEP